MMSSGIQSILASGRRVLLVALVVLIACGCSENQNNAPNATAPNATDRSPTENQNDAPNATDRSPTDRPMYLDVALQDMLVLQQRLYNS